MHPRISFKLRVSPNKTTPPKTANKASELKINVAKTARVLLCPKICKVYATTDNITPIKKNVFNHPKNIIIYSYLKKKNTKENKTTAKKT